MTVEKKRTNRTRQERLTDDIVERANNAQLIELLNSKAFRTSREKIQAKLANEQGIDFESFKRIHTMDECVLEKKTEREITTVTPIDIDFGRIHGRGTLDRYYCSYHDVESGYLVTDDFKKEQPYRPR